MKYTLTLPGDWRGARSTTLKGYESHYAHRPSQGFNGTDRYRVPVWYSFHLSGYFRSLRDAQEISRTFHKGWTADVDGGSSIVGIVVSLSHGRFAAGYRWTENGEHVIFSQVFDDETEAAQMADEHARVYAETCMEDSEKYDAARKLEYDIEDNLHRLRECIALRHRQCMTYVREEAAELITKIRMPANRCALSLRITFERVEDVQSRHRAHALRHHREALLHCCSMGRLS